MAACVGWGWGGIPVLRPDRCVPAPEARGWNRTGEPGRRPDADGAPRPRLKKTVRRVVGGGGGISMMFWKHFRRRSDLFGATSKPVGGNLRRAGQGSFECHGRSWVAFKATSRGALTAAPRGWRRGEGPGRSWSPAGGLVRLGDEETAETTREGKGDRLGACGVPEITGAPWRPCGRGRDRRRPSTARVLRRVDGVSEPDEPLWLVGRGQPPRGRTARGWKERHWETVQDGHVLV